MLDRAKHFAAFGSYALLDKASVHVPNVAFHSITALPAWPCEEPLQRQEAGTAWLAELGRLHALMTCLESMSCINDPPAGLMQVGRPVLSSMAKGSDAKRHYRLRRLADAWRYGSGSDFKH